MSHEESDCALRDAEKASHSISSRDASTERFDESQVDERGLMRRVDLRVLPVLCAMYLLAFLDRVNIGNAALFGLKGDLNLGGTEFNTALVIVFIPYILFEIPSNILLKRLRPRVWLSICSFGFGLVTLLQGFTQNFGGILATRFFLGVFEAGMLPGCYYVASMWYKRAEAQKRYTFLFSATSLAGAFGGLLASAIGKMDGIRGLLGWRWVFILEGLLTCVASLLFYFTIPDFPEHATWLREGERAFIKSRLLHDVGDSKIGEKITWKRCLRVIQDYKVILAGFMYLGLIVSAYSFVYFSPSIIQGLGHGSVHTQLLSVPPYAFAFVLSMTVATISDRCQHRFAFALGSSLLGLAGFIVLFIEHHNTNLQYAALFLAAGGSSTCMPIVLCWSSMNARGHTERAVSTAWQIGFGNIGGIVASYSFLAQDAPKYLRGYGICIGFLCFAVVSIIANFVGVSIENRRRAHTGTQSGPLFYYFT